MKTYKEFLNESIPTKAGKNGRKVAKDLEKNLKQKAFKLK